MEKNTNQIRIKNLSKKRRELYNIYQDSYDPSIGEFGDYTAEYPEEIDQLAEEIVDRIKSWRQDLPIEFILEELTQLGWAPCLLYDDEGHWAISGEGFQEVALGDPIDMHLTHFVEKKMWKDTIREALNYYLDNDE